MTAYYSEWDPYAAQWLRNLIKAGHLPAGDVDERSIADVRADELVGYDQCHFFAGIGGWAYAARLAGWPDARPLWTGSCPCQPYSVAGTGGGAADPRHLWPDFFRLIRACRPNVVMGEQVAAAVGHGWLDGVFADLESIDYACGAAVVPACAVNAPHRRDRVWFVADASGQGLAQRVGDAGVSRSLGRESEGEDFTDDAGAVAHAAGVGRQQVGRDAAGDTPPIRGWQGDWPCDGGHAAECDVEYADILGSRERRQQRSGQLGRIGSYSSARDCGAVGHTKRSGLHGQPRWWDDEQFANANRNVADTASERSPHRDARALSGRSVVERAAVESERRSGGAWDSAVWIIGHDGKSRRVEPGIRLLAHGVHGRMAVRRTVGQGDAEIQEEHWYNRVGALKAFGNAIVPQLAAEVIRAYMETRP